jgi:hypothetical protein
MGPEKISRSRSDAITRTQRPALLAIFETSFVNARAGYRGGNHEAHLFFRLSGRYEDRGGYGAPGLPLPMVQLPLEAAQQHAKGCGYFRAQLFSLFGRAERSGRSLSQHERTNTGQCNKETTIVALWRRVCCKDRCRRVLHVTNSSCLREDPPSWLRDQ